MIKDKNWPKHSKDIDKAIALICDSFFTNKVALDIGLTACFEVMLWTFRAKGMAKTKVDKFERTVQLALIEILESPDE